MHRFVPHKLILKHNAQTVLGLSFGSVGSVFGAIEIRPEFVETISDRPNPTLLDT